MEVYEQHHDPEQVRGLLGHTPGDDAAVRANLAGGAQTCGGVKQTTCASLWVGFVLYCVGRTRGRRYETARCDRCPGDLSARRAASSARPAIRQNATHRRAGIGIASASV